MDDLVKLGRESIAKYGVKSARPLWGGGWVQGDLNPELGVAFSCASCSFI